VSALQGLRVVELGVWVAGPSTAALLADWGADVVKIEPPQGDPFRQLFGALGYRPSTPNAPFALDNRGKRSIAVDLQAPAGKEVLERLIARADVFVTNLRPGALERLGLEPNDTVARHGHLVYAAITGYGLSGPDRELPAYDVGPFWSRSGMALQLVPPGTPPPPIRGGMGDHATALGAVAAVLAALHERTRTGKGRVVDVSLLRTGAFLMGWDLGIQMALGKVAPATDRAESPTPLLNCYRSGDGKWFFLTGLEADRHFPNLLRAIERRELADDPRFATAKERRRHGTDLVAELDLVFASRSLSEWAERFAQAEVWWAPAQTLDEVCADAQLRAQGGFVPVELPDGQAVESVAAPIGLGEWRGPGAIRVPAVGEHSREILEEAGFDAARVEALTRAGVVVPAPASG
jgi:crotonobetainyl-CoA:carnitine CoA-transferase CaiB-like acyl-CoA transferase